MQEKNHSSFDFNSLHYIPKYNPSLLHLHVVWESTTQTLHALISLFITLNLHLSICLYSCLGHAYLWRKEELEGKSRKWYHILPEHQKKKKRKLTLAPSESWPVRSAWQDCSRQSRWLSALFFYTTSSDLLTTSSDLLATHSKIEFSALTMFQWSWYVFDIK